MKVSSSIQLAGHQIVTILHLAAVLSLAFFWTPVFASGSNEIPVPDWMQKTFIADKMIINGMPSVVYSFVADRNSDTVLEFYRRQWDQPHSGGKGYREAGVEPWRVISRLAGRYLFTVQVKDDNTFTSSGFLAVADLHKIENNKNDQHEIPRMANSQIINDTKSFDSGQQGRTSMIVNKFSVATNGSFYQEYYLNRGWVQLERKALDDAEVLAFKKNGRQSHIVIRNTTKGSVIVMNQMQN